MRTIKKGPYKRIHVNASIIRERSGGRKAKRPIAVIADGSVSHTRTVSILGPARIIYSKRGLQSPYRAKVWIGTRAEVKYE